MPFAIFIILSVVVLLCRTVLEILTTPTMGLRWGGARIRASLIQYGPKYRKVPRCSCSSEWDRDTASADGQLKSPQILVFMHPSNSTMSFVALSCSFLSVLVLFRRASNDYLLVTKQLLISTDVHQGKIICGDLSSCNVYWREYNQRDTSTRLCESSSRQLSPPLRTAT